MRAFLTVARALMAFSMSFMAAARNLSEMSGQPSRNTSPYRTNMRLSGSSSGIPFWPLHAHGPHNPHGGYGLFYTHIIPAAAGSAREEGEWHIHSPVIL